ncbi:MULTISPECIES: methyltransferase family protein [unclassified Marinobacter]|jgi:protein-S-isoprenylcysteine O-methyltransferase Ste14|uniref:methyltransferase family protein n=1 Tax=unclassified Marinobacter TaxID=83889 RepID=UPI00192744FE|nr:MULTISPECIES: isoprenylcysteine carboxylmethyltransferase family protein [unclassified Marinobacter]MBL3824269.1 isoprenylcysteine carboxylmethyltransferase family protein [Marinobacter sp. MC3]MBL3892639.1 isoprenylcysteine carboxylmethyltransferase family protein [Marinobacter sp. MW3]
MLEKRIPPVALVLIVGLLMWLIAEAGPRVEFGDTLRLAVATALFLLGALFALAGVLAFRSSKTTVDPRKPESSSALVNSGVYRFSRNPMYVGFGLWLLAWGAFLASAWALIGVIVFVLYMNRFQIAPEERALRELFGEEFREYERRVRRWL